MQDTFSSSFLRLSVEVAAEVRQLCVGAES